MRFFILIVTDRHKFVRWYFTSSAVEYRRISSEGQLRLRSLVKNLSSSLRPFSREREHTPISRGWVFLSFWPLPPRSQERDFLLSSLKKKSQFFGWTPRKRDNFTPSLAKVALPNPLFVQCKSHFILSLHHREGKKVTGDSNMISFCLRCMVCGRCPSSSATPTSPWTSSAPPPPSSTWSPSASTGNSGNL